MNIWLFWPDFRHPQGDPYIKRCVPLSTRTPCVPPALSQHRRLGTLPPEHRGPSRCAQTQQGAYTCSSQRKSTQRRSRGCGSLPGTAASKACIAIWLQNACASSHRRRFTRWSAIGVSITSVLFWPWFFFYVTSGQRIMDTTTFNKLDVTRFDVKGLLGF